MNDTTHNGKIARLPRALREQLNQQLDDGEPGGQLLEWLNGLEQVKHVLAQDFGGRPINEQNLSNWRQGGHQHWRKQQERRNLVRELTENAAELDAAAGGVEIGNHLSAVLTAELAESAREMLATITDPAERCARMEELLRTLTHVRREDWRAGRLEIERERRARERAGEQEHDDYCRENSFEIAPFMRRMKRSRMADYYAQPDFTSQAVATGYAESLLRSTKPDQAESN